MGGALGATMAHMGGWGFPRLLKLPASVALQAEIDQGKQLQGTIDALTFQLYGTLSDCRRGRQAAGTELVIPDASLRSGDLGFLSGCWNNESGLENLNTGRPVIVSYCFDASGRGHTSVHDSDGLCRGPVRAAINPNGRLDIKAEFAVCPGGGSYTPVTVACQRGESGKASCLGRNQGGGRTWTATFRKTD